MSLGPAKHEKVARIGRISNVFRVLSACDTRLARTEAERRCVSTKCEAIRRYLWQRKDLVISLILQAIWR